MWWFCKTCREIFLIRKGFPSFLFPLRRVHAVRRYSAAVPEVHLAWGAVLQDRVAHFLRVETVGALPLFARPLAPYAGSRCSLLRCCWVVPDADVPAGEAVHSVQRIALHAAGAIQRVRRSGDFTNHPLVRGIPPFNPLSFRKGLRSCLERRQSILRPRADHTSHGLMQSPPPHRQLKRCHFRACGRGANCGVPHDICHAGDAV